MSHTFSPYWQDPGFFSVFRSPFLVPSIILHALFIFGVLRAVDLNLSRPEPDAPITVRLTDFEGKGSDTKSIGARRGPGGPRELPKAGTPIAPKPRQGERDSGSLESPEPTQKVQPPPPTPKPVSLPGPKNLAADTRSEAVNINETSPSSLVQLPTQTSPTQFASSATATTTLNRSSLPTVSGVESAGIKALDHGAQIPGALRGTGKATGASGVPGGSRQGGGLAGGGTGTGAGGGSRSGLKGISNADFDLYLKQLERRVKSHWKYPEEVTGVQEVAVRFSLDQAGKLIEAQVLDSSDTRLNASAVEAMKRASPFPPIPLSLAKDLANEPLIVRFKVSIRVRG